MKVIELVPCNNCNGCFFDDECYSPVEEEVEYTPPTKPANTSEDIF